MQDLLEKDRNSSSGRAECYLPAGWPWRNPETVSRYVKREKLSFAAYCGHRLPRTRPSGGVFLYRRRQSTLVSPKVPVSTGLACVPLETVKTFIELLELPHGWNSYGAKQIRKENVNVAIGLLGRVMRPGTPPPIVVPTVRGGVQLEWHTKGINLEIAIDSEADISFFAEDIRTREVPEDLDESSLVQWIERISTR